MPVLYLYCTCIPLSSHCKWCLWCGILIDAFFEPCKVLKSHTKNFLPNHYQIELLGFRFYSDSSVNRCRFGCYLQFIVMSLVKFPVFLTEIPSWHQVCPMRPPTGHSRSISTVTTTTPTLQMRRLSLKRINNLFIVYSLLVEQPGTKPGQDDCEPGPLTALPHCPVCL